MKAIYNTLILSVLVTLFAACSHGGNDSGERVLTVSVEPQRALLQELAGDRFKVVTLLANGANPEQFDPSMQTRISAEKSEAYFTTGAMPFERNLVAALPAAVRVVDTGKGIVPVYGTHGHHHHDDHADHDDHHGHHHDAGEPDPHIWASVRNARVMAANMVEALCELDSANATEYRSRHAALANRLDSLDRAFTAALATAPVRAFAVWHPSLSYFARDYGLEQVAVGFENKEMSPRRLAEVCAEARSHGVRVLFFQREYDSRQAEALNTQMGTRLVTVNPLAADWEAELTKIVDNLSTEK